MIIRITNERDGTYAEIKVEDEITTTDLIIELKGLLVAFGYHPNNVDEMFDYERWNNEEEMLNVRKK